MEDYAIIEFCEGGDVTLQSYRDGTFSLRLTEGKNNNQLSDHTIQLKFTAEQLIRLQGSIDRILAGPTPLEPVCDECGCISCYCER